MNNDNLSNRLSKIESQIKAIKVNQKTQNDSFSLHTYSSGNLAFSGTEYRDYTIRFIPTNTNADEVICQFFSTDMGATQYRPFCAVDAANPLICRFKAMGYGSMPAWRRNVYILCIANCEGELVVSS